ncbi:AAA family ATPase [Arthrobacter sp. SLBN-122]|uniref:AAA family ATPase n=1 Tax=Arthrobacter sp. SLBN-122 TaxID=2768455 RepID=UPI00114EDC7A|nr:AAA family ATPase [Arthrobacter sp. SLBN-122]TQJ34312.1 AAA domain-containing protein [Arthrobacter sp. SLBN-122]
MIVNEPKRGTTYHFPDFSPAQRGALLYIQRVQVETEGFLSGLDVEFSPGLNVIIGARGTGKTSLIELIRYCLGAGAFTEDAANRGRQQAVAILEGGAVTVTMRDGDSSFLVTRSASGHVTTTGTRQPTCTVLAQNEVEAVGAQAAGRLHLIDRFRANRDETAKMMSNLLAHVRSLTTEILAILNDGGRLSEQIASMSAVTADLDEARKHQQQLLDNARATEDQQLRLLSLQQDSQRLALRESVVDQSESSVESLAGALTRLASDASSVLQTWPADDQDDPLTGARFLLADVERLLNTSLTRLAEVRNSLQAARNETAQRQVQVDEASRQLRQSLEELQAGIGLTTRRVVELEEYQGQLFALQNRLSERTDRLRSVSAQRDSVQLKAEELRDQVYSDRLAIVRELNRTLAPAIRIRLAKSENLEAYRSTIVAALRGSGLHYNSLAPMLAQAAAPHEVVSWVEQNNATELGGAIGISPDRASSIIAALRAGGTPDIIASTVEDGVTLELLDGQEFKASDRLSIGQRCTTVLPILLGHHGDPLIVDQPEDHLDNAFIASTLVSALQSRQPSDQFIFSSHNANIPVLGGANRVLVMNSDGDRGYLTHAGDLDAPEIIAAVTDIMEGGERAFATRAAFYRNETVSRR